MSKRRTVSLLAAVATLVSVWAIANTVSAATSYPADKAGVVASDVDTAGPGERMELLATHMRTSNPADLILGVTAECSLVTDVSTMGMHDDESASGTSRIWVTIDGKTVPVARDANGGPEDDGKVTFCNRFYERSQDFVDPSSTIKTYLRTRQAHAFNWVALNVGAGIHELKVLGELTTTATEGSNSEIAVGKRSLVIQPTHMAVNESKSN